MRIKRKYDLDKLLGEIEEDEKMATGPEKQKHSQADIQEMIERKREKENT